jgi:hypothetical protein
MIYEKLLKKYSMMSDTNEIPIKDPNYYEIKPKCKKLLILDATLNNFFQKNKNHNQMRNTLESDLFRNKAGIGSYENIFNKDANNMTSMVFLIIEDSRIFEKEKTFS